MSTLSLRIAATVILLWGISASAQNANNPIEDALLRWYQANTAAQFTNVLSSASPPCTTPAGLAFDGAHMWVACFGSNSLLELNVSDGSPGPVRSVPLASPSFLLYDGKNIWATNKVAGTITPVNASTGAVGTSLTVNTMGTTPAGMTFDGQNIWVALSGTSSQQIAKVNVTTGTVTWITLTYTPPITPCVNPAGIVYYAPDPGVPIANNLSQSLWVVCNAIPNQVAELNLSGQVLAATRQNMIGSCVCNNIAFDGRYVWTATPSVGMPAIVALQQVDTTTNPPTVTNTRLPDGTSPYAVAFDGIYVWVIDGSNSNVFKVLPSTTSGQSGTKYGPFTNPGGASSFLGFDGGNMWVSTADSSNGTYSLQKM
jgi:hypothetical protein